MGLSETEVRRREWLNDYSRPPTPSKHVAFQQGSDAHAPRRLSIDPASPSGGTPRSVDSRGSFSSFTTASSSDLKLYSIRLLCLPWYLEWSLIPTKIRNRFKSSRRESVRDLTLLGSADSFYLNEGEDVAVDESSKMKQFEDISRRLAGKSKGVTRFQLLKILFALTSTMALMTAANLHYEQESRYSVHSAIKGALLWEELEEVSSVDDFWNWLTQFGESLMPYPSRERPSPLCDVARGAANDNDNGGLDSNDEVNAIGTHNELDERRGGLEGSAFPRDVSKDICFLNGHNRLLGGIVVAQKRRSGAHWAKSTANQRDREGEGDHAAGHGGDVDDTDDMDGTEFDVGPFHEGFAYLHPWEDEDDEEKEEGEEGDASSDADHNGTAKVSERSIKMSELDALADFSGSFGNDEEEEPMYRSVRDFVDFLENHFDLMMPYLKDSEALAEEPQEVREGRPIAVHDPRVLQQCVDRERVDQRVWFQETGDWATEECTTQTTATFGSDQAKIINRPGRWMFNHTTSFSMYGPVDYPTQPDPQANIEAGEFFTYVELFMRDIQDHPRFSAGVPVFDFWSFFYYAQSVYADVPPQDSAERREACAEFDHMMALCSPELEQRRKRKSLCLVDSESFLQFLCMSENVRDTLTKPTVPCSSHTWSVIKSKCTAKSIGPRSPTITLSNHHANLPFEEMVALTNQRGFCPERKYGAGKVNVYFDPERKLVEHAIPDQVLPNHCDGPNPLDILSSNQIAKPMRERGFRMDTAGSIINPHGRYFYTCPYTYLAGVFSISIDSHYWTYGTDGGRNITDENQLEEDMYRLGKSEFTRKYGGSLHPISLTTGIHDITHFNPFAQCTWGGKEPILLSFMDNQVSFGPSFSPVYESQPCNDDAAACVHYWTVPHQTHMAACERVIDEAYRDIFETFLTNSSDTMTFTHTKDVLYGCHQSVNHPRMLHLMAPFDSTFSAFTVLIDCSARNNYEKLVSSFIQLMLLKEDEFIDAFTRSVEVSFASYNLHHDIITLVSAEFMFDTTSAVNVHLSIESASIRTADTTIWSMRRMAEIVFLVTLVMSTVSELFETKFWRCEERIADGLRRYISKSKNWVDVTRLVLGYSLVTLRFDIAEKAEHVRHIAAASLASSAEDSKESLTDALIHPLSNEMKELIEMEAVYKKLIGVELFIMILWLLKYFAKHPRTAVVSDIITDVAADLLHLLFVFFIMAFVFATVGILYFGQDMFHYSGTFISVASTLRVLFGDFEYEDLFATSKTGTILFFWLVQIMGFLVLLNIVIAIVTNAFRKQHRSQGEDGDRNIFNDFVTLFVFDAFNSCKVSRRRRRRKRKHRASHSSRPKGASDSDENSKDASKSSPLKD